MKEVSRLLICDTNKKKTTTAKCEIEKHDILQWISNLREKKMRFLALLTTTGGISRIEARSAEHQISIKMINSGLGNTIVSTEDQLIPWL